MGCGRIWSSWAVVGPWWVRLPSAGAWEMASRAQIGLVLWKKMHVLELVGTFISQ